MERTALHHKIQCVIGELKSLATIKFGQKWCVAYGAPQNVNIGTRLMRTWWYTSETKTVTITYVESVYDKSFNLMTALLSNVVNYVRPEDLGTCQQFQLMKNINEQIISSKLGVINLKGAYHQDEPMKTSIDQVIKSVDRRMRAVRKRLNAYLKVHRQTIPGPVMQSLPPGLVKSPVKRRTEERRSRKGWSMNNVESSPNMARSPDTEAVQISHVMQELESHAHDSSSNSEDEYVGDIGNMMTTGSVLLASQREDYDNIEIALDGFQLPESVGTEESISSASPPSEDAPPPPVPPHYVNESDSEDSTDLFG